MTHSRYYDASKLTDLHTEVHVYYFTASVIYHCNNKTLTSNITQHMSNVYTLTVLGNYKRINHQ